MYISGVTAPPPADIKYDVCLSFAGEQRYYVERIADGLRRRGVKVFYDGYEKASLWGKDLYQHLDLVYRQAARYCVIFVSVDYARKVWPSHELQSAQARALVANAEYVLPARFDDTPIPGLRGTIGYLDLRSMESEELIDLIARKVFENYPSGGPDLTSAASSPRLAAPLRGSKDIFKPAKLKPRYGGGELGAIRTGEQVLALVPLEGGGRLALELERSAAKILGAKLKDIVG